ncbi:collagen-like triple helix repeat-containing protein [Flagellimonas allohymeniacidonis]|uniref:Collagen-like protein n=1 Tax=Flagellimonas allohymeniacidonis TaxID=2517819 RepID=A0A4Q8QD29_9FLAO|nr:collagen-like protein [Allomuricauda hymeniacidonis]TAI46998.1 collagen-like protein [Allomuricauda hymeniacidonis]
MKALKLFSAALMAVTLCLTSCSPEDGTDGQPGIDGQQGNTGPVGDMGSTGATGENGVGFDELTQYGNVSLVLKGTRLDGVEFEDSALFKFTPIDFDDEYQNNTYIHDESLDNVFVFTRYLSSPGDSPQQTYVQFYVEVSNLGETDQAITYKSFYINDYAVIGDDNKYFVVDNGYDDDETEISSFTITDLTFDEETHNLTFSYAIAVNADYEGNGTGHDLSISGEVDVIVFEEITGI